MQADERDVGYLWDMREAARDCIDFVKEATYEQFSADKMMHSAVERRLEILGEAASRISEVISKRPPRDSMEGDQGSARRSGPPVR